MRSLVRVLACLPFANHAFFDSPFLLVALRCRPSFSLRLFPFPLPFPFPFPFPSRSLPHSHFRLRLSVFRLLNDAILAFERQPSNMAVSSVPSVRRDKTAVGMLVRARSAPPYRKSTVCRSPIIDFRSRSDRGREKKRNMKKKKRRTVLLYWANRKTKTEEEEERPVRPEGMKKKKREQEENEERKVKTSSPRSTLHAFAPNSTCTVYCNPKPKPKPKTSQKRRKATPAPPLSRLFFPFPFPRIIALPFFAPEAEHRVSSARVLKLWNVGMVECWNVRMLGCRLRFFSLFSLFPFPSSLLAPPFLLPPFCPTKKESKK